MYGIFKDKESKEAHNTRKLHDLKLAFSEFYLSLILLQNYQTLNFTGFRKILKKHDKLMQTNHGAEWRLAQVEPAPFYTNKEVDHLIKDVEGLACGAGCWLPEGVSNPAHVLWAGSVLSYLYSEIIGLPPMAMPLAMAGLLLLLLLNPIKVFYYRARMWLLRILFRIFTAPFHHVGFADFWLADQLNSLVSVMLDFEYLVCYYAFEVDWLPGPASEPVCMKSMYGIRSVVACLPAWFRFAQCLRRYRDTKLIFPHVVNAGKYSTTFFVQLFATLYKVHIEVYSEDYRQNSVFFYLWIVAYIASSCYTLTWDIKMDWGLLDKGAGDNRFLREEVVYAFKAYYYFAMVEDSILRFIWILKVSVGEAHLIPGEILGTILALLEVFRRFVWNFFRLENEHLNNCGQFRAVRDISIGPIDSNFEQQLIDIMDDEDGIESRILDRRRMSKPKKDARLWVDEDDEKVPLVNGDKRVKRV
nr:hypothetical protein BaRGS_034274 [Batillaria attramentaria]